MLPQWLRIGAGALVLALTAPASHPAASQEPAPSLALHVLSSRPDMVTGGDALVEVVDRARTLSADEVVVEANGRDVSSAFRLDAERHALVGLVEGLTNGANVLTARAGAEVGRLEVTNFPITGPIFAVNRVTRYECRTVEAGLGEPLDDDCSARSKVEYFYRTKAPGRVLFKPLADPAALPADVAQARSAGGAMVPYVVRVESGTIDRGIYRIAMLADPAGWNRRLVFAFGGGCGVHHDQGVNQPADVLLDPVLSRGFALATSTGLVLDQHCSDIAAAEAVTMLKEHIIERYGVPKWTIGAGASGGAIEQLLVAQNFPWLLDGLLPSLTFPDAVSLAPSITDCRLLLRYFSRTGTWSAAKQSAVEGYSAGTCDAWDKTYVDAAVAGAMSGPGGRTIDNVGVQYGLSALNAGSISKVEFLDLNANIGGFSADGRPSPGRTAATPQAIQAAYETGRVNLGRGGLATIPIIEYRSYNDARGDIHDRVRDVAVRRRLQKANGRAANQVVWLYPGEPAGLAQRISTLALDTITTWLDTGTKPAAAVDGCWDVIGTKIPEPLDSSKGGLCNALYPPHANPRLVAGAPPADDILKCRLKPIDSREYHATFSAEELLRLHLIFPDGVCDYSKPGLGQPASR